MKDIIPNSSIHSWNCVLRYGQQEIIAIQTFRMENTDANEDTQNLDQTDMRCP